MTYTPSPRPRFDGPAYIAYETTARHLWGDPDAGEVADWIYVSSDKIHQLVFGLPSGGMFRHSEEHRTIFAADEVYYVLSGIMLIANPATGEVHRVERGEAAFFRRDTWHHAMSVGVEPLRVLELFAPPPSRGTSGAYARTQPYLERSIYRRDHLLGRWPMARQDAQHDATIQVVRENDVLWHIEGRDRLTPVGLLASTDQLTVGTITLLAGQQTEPHVHGGDESLYVLDGALNVRLPEYRGARWHELRPGDGFYIPEGEPHQYYNVAATPARLIFGVAPAYLPAQP
ncbi:MAG: cupin domain-containing protein [Chloroflexi bacterium]|nr:cupin domain-containing protein [Chloroflexota bacterium]